MRINPRMTTDSPAGSGLRHDAARRRYEMRVEGRLVAFAEYRLAGDAVIFTRTELAPGQDPRGHGRLLARAALEDVRGQARYVIPMCPFVAEYIRRRPQYFGLVRWSMRARLPG